jgi:hypothetical protein
MEMEGTSEQKTKKTATLAIGKRFKGFQPESERATSKADVKDDRVLGQLKEAWRVFSSSYEMVEHKYRHHEHHGFIMLGFFDEVYAIAEKIINKQEYTAEDVERFCINFVEFQNEKDFSTKAGLLLSALINKGEDKDFRICTRHLTMPLRYVGYTNTKNIAVEGDLGDNIGKGMKGGTITIEGNCGNYAGSGMQGGEIHIHGEIRLVGTVIHGKIQHQGKVLVNK